MPRTQLSLSTCNLYNLNEPGLSIYTDSNGWDSTQYEKKKHWTANEIETTQSDVWAFQECWHRQSLAAVLDRAGLTNDYTLLVPENHERQKIVCAAAVKSHLLVDEPQWISDFPDIFRLTSGGGDPQTSRISVQIDTFSRPVLHFKIKPCSNGKIIHVYVSHFKSKGHTKIYRESWYSSKTYSKHSEAIGSAISTIQRTAEATALRLIMTKQMKNTDTPVIVMGDLNDSQQSNILNILTGQPNYLLAGYSEGGSDVDLYSVGTLQEYRSQRDVYYTHLYNKTRELPDHIRVRQENL